MDQERAILHFNVADFAVAVERLADRGLQRRPVIIAPLPAARAEVYDMSEEAYQAGVRKGMALRQASRMCREARILPPRVEAYHRAMQQLLREAKAYSPLIEYGRDDGHLFVDVTGTHRLFGPAQDVGLRVRRHLRDRLGLQPIWTLATNKLVAKVASRLVKPVGEYIVGPGEEQEFLAPLSISLLPGVASLEIRRLAEFQITTVGQLADLSRHQLMVPFGNRSGYFYDISRGIDSSLIQAGAETAQLVDCQHTFADDTNDQQEVAGVIAELVSRAGLHLRQRRQAARRVVLSIRYADGSLASRQISVKQGTNSDFALLTLARTALARVWQRRTRLRACRLVCDQLHRQSPQLLLFPAAQPVAQRQEKILTALDTIRNRFGHDSVGGGRRPLPASVDH